MHQRTYFHMYRDQHFYNGICDALSTLVLSGVGNVQEAKCELRQFCIRVHHYTYGDLCGSCEITKNLIEEMENGYPYMHRPHNIHHHHFGI